MARSKIIKNNKALPKNKVIKKYKRANGEGTIYQEKTADGLALLR